MIHLIGYLGLVLNLVSMTMKEILNLRFLSMTANGIYVVYGILLDAPPITIGCAIAFLIHLFHIIKLKKAEGEK